jgi:hypothetical protein
MTEKLRGCRIADERQEPSSVAILNVRLALEGTHSTGQDSLPRRRRIVTVLRESERI